MKLKELVTQLIERGLAAGVTANQAAQPHGPPPVAIKRFAATLAATEPAPTYPIPFELHALECCLRLELAEGFIGEVKCGSHKNIFTSKNHVVHGSNFTLRVVLSKGQRRPRPWANTDTTLMSSK